MSKITQHQSYFWFSKSSKKYFPAEKSVMKNKWNYEPFIGRQINYLRIGVIGLGRLGSIFLKYKYL